MGVVIPVENIDHEFLEQLIERFEQFHTEAEKISINLEKNPEKMGLVRALQFLFDGLLYETLKLNITLLSECLHEAIKILLKVLEWKFYPVPLSEFILLVIDKIMELAHDLSFEETINIRKAQQILIPVQHIVLVRHPEDFGVKIEEAISEITEEKYSCVGDEDHKICTMIFDKIDSDPEPLKEKSSEITPIEIPAPNGLAGPNVIKAANDPILQARDYIESQIFNRGVNLVVKISDAATDYSDSHSRFLLELCYATNVIAGSPIDPYALSVGVCFHDIGLAAHPLIDIKSPTLTDHELSIVRQHPLEGAKLMKEFHDNSTSIEIVCDHHERENGSGYPHGIKGNSINEAAKLVGIVDTFHELLVRNTSNTYAKNVLLGLSEINSHSGTLYDSLWVQSFNKCLSDYWLPENRRIIN